MGWGKRRNYYTIYSLIRHSIHGYPIGIDSTSSRHKIVGMQGKKLDEAEYIKIGECITLKSIVINILLALVKIITGWIGNSTAIMADGIHSASDLLSDFGILATLRISRLPPDGNHHYGHRKVETLTAFLLGITLSLIGLSFTYNGITKIVHLLQGTLSYEISPIVVLGAILTVISKEWIYQATLKVGKELNNNAITANAWHHRSDALSSVCTAIGVSLAIWGGSALLIMDPVMTIFVAFFILKTAISILRKNGSILLDTGADDELTHKIRKIAGTIQGVKDVHEIRSRYHGNDLFLDLHVVVDPQWTVQRSHDLCEDIETCLKQHIEIILDIVIHIEPSEY